MFEKKEYKIYKPNRKDPSRGCATTWEINLKTKNTFVMAAKQNTEYNGDNPTFDWANKETIKLGQPDIAELLLLIKDKKQFLGNATPDNKGSGLYHESKKGNVILKLYQYKDGPSYVLEISAKKNGALFRAAHLLSRSELLMLEIFLSYAASVSFDLSGQPA